MNKYKQQKQERIFKRCEILTKLGFEVYHEDASVAIRVGDEEVMIDFSAIDETKFMEYAFKKVLEHGIRLGKNRIRGEIHNLLKFE